MRKKQKMHAVLLHERSGYDFDPKRSGWLVSDPESGTVVRFLRVNEDRPLSHATSLRRYYPDAVTCALYVNVSESEFDRWLAIDSRSRWSARLRRAT